jgi:hypothetical protein
MTEADLSGSAASALPRRWRLITWVVVVVAIAFLVAWFVAILQIPPRGTGPSDPGPGDGQQYIRAALRLNAEQPLYGYDATTGSFVAVDDYLSPPLLAVVFRVIVLLPAHGANLWWGAMVLFEISALVALVRRVPLVVSLATVVLGLSIDMAMWQGNVDCLVMPGLVLAWYWLSQGRDRRAALSIGLLASLKLTPLVFVWWLLVTGRRSAAGVAVGFGVALAVVTIIGSEPLVFRNFAGVTIANVEAPSSAFGSSGFAYALGLPSFAITWLPRLILTAGVAAMWICRRRPRVAWAIGASLMWLSSPVASVHTPALLLVALAPLAWPIRDLDRKNMDLPNPPHSAEQADRSAKHEMGVWSGRRVSNPRHSAWKT